MHACTHTHMHTHAHAHAHAHTCTRMRMHTRMHIFHCVDPATHNHTPRLFELSTTTGKLLAHEVLYPARYNEVEAFPFLQRDIYSAVQPGE